MVTILFFTLLAQQWDLPVLPSCALVPKQEDPKPSTGPGSPRSPSEALR